MSGLLVLALTAASLAAPRAATVELNAWRAAVKSGDAARIAHLLPEGATLTVRVRMSPTPAPDRTLSRDSLEAALKVSGGPNELGLSAQLMLPTAAELRRAEGGRYAAQNAKCPEVRWIFAPVGKRFVLVEIVRTLLDC